MEEMEIGKWGVENGRVFSFFLGFFLSEFYGYRGGGVYDEFVF